MATYDELAARLVLITGGANGIGEAMVKAFHAQGAVVCFCDLDDRAGVRLAKRLGDRAEFAKVNLTREADIKRWVARLAKRHGNIHVLINNAARDPRIALEDVTAKAWDDLFAANIRAYFLTCREASPHLAKGASIVNFSSITFYTAPVNMSAYVATKAAAIGLTRSLARELGPRRIRVNTISPGWIMTKRQLSDHVTPAVKRQIRAAQCIPDLNQPDEVAAVALFLASDASRAVTGQEILVDRGWVSG
ncbi:MAG: SDR family NAD(P)-dependent oxidoreductase [Verrucomicrobiota bacterium]|nr:SDR family NAD(P)-dependent oxidoreductase [Verrucomicrobiota bacterium]